MNDTDGTETAEPGRQQILRTVRKPWNRANKIRTVRRPQTLCGPYVFSGALRGFANTRAGKYLMVLGMRRLTSSVHPDSWWQSSNFLPSFFTDACPCLLGVSKPKSAKWLSSPLLAFSSSARRTKASVKKYVAEMILQYLQFPELISSSTLCSVLGSDISLALDQLLTHEICPNIVMHVARNSEISSSF